MKCTQTIKEWLEAYFGESIVDMSKFNVESKESDDLKASANQGKSYKFTIKAVDSVTYPANEWNDKPETKPTLFFEETDKRLVVRPKNTLHLREKYGDDSNNWLGKTIACDSESWTNGNNSGWMWTVRALDVEFDAAPAPVTKNAIEPGPDDFDDEIPF